MATEILSKFEKAAMAIARCVATKLEGSPYDNDKGKSIFPKYNFKIVFLFQLVKCLLNIYNVIGSVLKDLH